MYNSISLWFNMASNFDSYVHSSVHSITNQNRARASPRPMPNLYEEEPSSSEMSNKVAVRKVYVGNVNPRTTLNALRDYFADFGEIQNAHFARTNAGTKPTYGFVTYYKPEDAATAIEVCQTGGIPLHGRRLIVNEADQKHQPQTLANGRILWYPRTKQSVWSANRGRGKVTRVRKLVTRGVDNDIDESKCVLHLLNDDCLRLIFALLPKRDLVKVERVCKRWQEVSRSMWLTTKVLTFSDLGLRRRSLNMKIVAQLFERCGSCLVNVDLSYHPSSLNPSVLHMIADKCPNLDTLNLASLLLTFPGLKAIGYKCQELRHVNLESFSGVKDQDIQSFFVLCKNLKSVILSRNSMLMGSCLEGLNKETIESISLNGCTGLLSDAMNKHISLFSNLRHLDIDQCINLCSRDLNAMLNALTQLTSLSMRQYYPNISHLSFKTISNLKELVSLNVSQNSSITDEVLEAIARGCKKLQFLDISGCSTHADPTVGDGGIAAIAKLPQLTSLKISYMAIVSDLALMAIAENAPKLQILECRGCPSFNDFGCSRVVTLCNELRLFDFSGCDHVSNETGRAACAAVKLRTNKVPLKLIVGGTLVEKSSLVNDMDMLLEVSCDNLCVTHLRPDFADSHYYTSDSDDDDDFEDLYDVDFDVVGSPALFFGDDLGEYYGYLAFMEGQGFDNSDFECDNSD